MRQSLYIEKLTLSLLRKLMGLVSLNGGLYVCMEEGEYAVRGHRLSLFNRLRVDGEFAGGRTYFLHSAVPGQTRQVGNTLKTVYFLKSMIADDRRELRSVKELRAQLLSQRGE